jgi:hypothetical protein
MIQQAFNPTAVNALASVITRIIRGRSWVPFFLPRNMANLRMHENR